jgi:hypothetical protein
MAPISAAAVSGTLELAYRAALLLTGSAELAEIAVLNGIASLEIGDDVEKTLVAKTVEFVIRRPDYEDRVKRALALQPHDEFRRLIYLAPKSRDIFLLRVLFGIPSARCAAILKLTIEELETSLSAALRRLCVLGLSDLVAGSNTPNTGEQK